MYKQGLLIVARDGCQALKEYVVSMKAELPEPDSSQWMSRMVRIFTYMIAMYNLYTCG